VTSECLPFAQIPHTTSLFADFLSNHSKVQQFYPRSANFTSWMRDEAGKLRYDLERREQVCAVLERQNMGARLFNVASMLSNVVTPRGERQLVLHIVNYSDYPGSGITARVPGNWRRARLFRPGEAPVELEIEKVEEGIGFAIDQRVVSIATVVLE